EQLPEVGDTEKPRLVFFFDEAHLLFDDAPKALLDKIEQVVRLVRSKGVGVYFVSQNPMDIPETVLGQLGNRVQHALRAFTPRDQKAVRAAAQTFRANPNLDVESVITQLGVGEALVSVLDDRGIPTVVERCLIRPPESRMGPITPQERSALMARSELQQKYSITTDRESAYEILNHRATGAADQGQRDLPREEMQRSRPATPSARDGLVEAMAKSALRAIGSQLGRQIVRGVMGSILRGR
ncbi:MAG: helicase HerA-like domain-containing protein, partial [Burkholderiales bacterium]